MKRIGLSIFALLLAGFVSQTAAQEMPQPSEEHKLVMKDIGTWILASDRALVLAFHRLRSKQLTWLMQIFTYSASTPAWVVLITSIYLINRAESTPVVSDPWLLSLIPAVAASAIGNSLRPLLKRPRPHVAIDEHDAIVWVPQNHSMPSSHAASTVAWFFALYLFSQPMSVLVGVWALLVTLSRLYLGVHYPTDLLAGIALGLAVGGGFHLIL